MASNSPIRAYGVEPAAKGLAVPLDLSTLRPSPARRREGGRHRGDDEPWQRLTEAWLCRRRLAKAAQKPRREPLNVWVARTLGLTRK
jgi:hypothetical protein